MAQVMKSTPNDPQSQTAPTETALGSSASASLPRVAGLSPRQLARQLRSTTAVAAPPRSYDVVYKRSTQAEPGTHLMFGNSGGRVKTPGGTVRSQSSRPWTPNSTINGQSGLQHAHQWEHVTARARGPRVGHFLGRTREHQLAVSSWAKQAPSRALWRIWRRSFN